MDLFNKKDFLPKEEVDKLEKEEASKKFSKSYQSMQTNVEKASKENLNASFWIAIWKLISTILFGIFIPKEKQKQLN